MGRYFLKLNSAFKYGFFTINPENGQISFKVISNIEVNQKYVFDQENFKSLVRVQMNTLSQAVKFHIVKILFLMNLISQTRYEKITNTNTNVKQVPKDHNEIIQLISTWFSKCHVPLPEELNNKLKLQTPPSKVLTEIKIEAIPKKDENHIQQGGFCRVCTAIVNFTINEQKKFDSNDHKNKRIQ